MTILKIAVPPHADLAVAEVLVERVCQTEGLTVASKSSLRSFPGSVHWHLKKEGEKGVLELTLWPAKRRLWASVHANRAGGWTDDALGRVGLELGRALAAES